MTDIPQPKVADWRRWRQVRRARAPYRAYCDWREIDAVANE